MFEWQHITFVLVHPWGQQAHLRDYSAPRRNLIWLYTQSSALLTRQMCLSGLVQVVSVAQANSTDTLWLLLSAQNGGGVSWPRGAYVTSLGHTVAKELSRKSRNDACFQVYNSGAVQAN